ncbi:EAL domain-containing protein [Rugamonas apoptosis]|uniref:EAL domain-containing protein n=1 Tax=Rugamonas apoptosis TaxID=2758570 RepID=A0A7W2ILJ7_9BURK|nr:EAL domain-containing protein [Rugamonas apoptosis]MBA5688639.1 EAL domain-containing protein [Rugamonas apoptosis]
MLLSCEFPIKRLVTRDLLACAPDTPLLDVAKLMAARRCSSILVLDGESAVGIFTESDVLAFDLSNPALAMQPVSSAMSGPVQTIHGDLLVGEAAVQFKRNGIRHLLVVDERGQRLGMLSQSDVVLNQGAEFFLRMRAVSSIPCQTPLVLAEEMALDEAVAEMRRCGRDAAIISFADGGHGIFTQRDIVRLIANHGGPLGTVGGHASRPLRSVQAGQSLYLARKMLAQNKIRHLGVLDDDERLVGLLSFDDILSSIEDEYVSELGAALRERDQALWESRYHLRLADRVFESTLEGVMVTRADGTIERVNPAFETLTGYSAEEAIGRNANMLSSKRQTPEFYQQMWGQLAATGCWQGEIWNRRRDGELYLEHLTISSICDDAGVCTHYAAIFADITQRRMAEERLNYLATHDALTGLPNRSLFGERLEHALRCAQRAQHSLGVLFLDLDRFKLVNDSLGHGVGDELLKMVGERLRACVREADTVARLGGDEFTLLLEDVGDARQVAHIAQKLLDAIGAPFHISGEEIYVTPSIGVSMYPDDGGDAQTLVLHADRAMYEAKGAGKNNFQFYIGQMNTDTNEQLQIESDLRQALERDELVLHYQPKVDLADGAVVGLEALVRWQHPSLGLLAPGRFIPIAEETALIVPLGQAVLREACRQGRAWLDAGYVFGSMAVNLSLRQLRWEGFLHDVDTILAETGFPAEYLQLELIESQAIDGCEQCEGVLQALAGRGISLAIDDFGVGYSSFVYLKSLPFDTLKVDRSLLAGAGHSRRDVAVLRAILAMADALDMKVVMEGVETEDEAAMLRTIGCPQVQGWLFGRAQPAHEVEQRLAHCPTVHYTSQATRSRPPSLAR